MLRLTKQTWDGLLTRSLQMSRDTQFIVITHNKTDDGDGPRALWRDDGGGRRFEACLGKV